MKIAPKYTVTEFDKSRSFKQTVYELKQSEHDQKRYDIVPKQIIQKGGYLVKFPNGNSIRVESKEMLMQLGLDQSVGMVDLDTGEDVPFDANGNIDFRTMVSRSMNSSGEEQPDLFKDDLEEAEVN